IIVSLYNLPNELLYEITSYLDSLSDLNAFSQVSRHFYSLANDGLYRFAQRWYLGQAIQWAAEKGRLTSAKKLIKKCRDCLGTVEGKEPIVIAAENGHPKLVQLLLRHSFPNDTKEQEAKEEAVLFRKTLIGAVQSGHENIIRLLFKHRPHIEFYKRNFFAAFPLCEAARHHRLSVAKLLINCQCGPNDHVLGGMTPLVLAISTKPAVSDPDAALKIARLLIKTGANIDNDTEMFIETVRSQNLALIKLLIKNGFSPQRLGTEVILKEFSRIKRRNTAMASLMLEWIDVGSIITSGGRHCSQLLRVAIFHRLHDLLKELIEDRHFLDEPCTTQRKATRLCPMSLAACYGSRQTIQLLLANGASPDGETGIGQPLGLALGKSCNLRNARILLDNGADGTRAMGNAIDSQNWRIVEFLSPFVADYCSAIEREFWREFWDQ
ncbi:unnamed protein product, partial [Penicillium salamii]